MKILVTGGAGFIGANIAEGLLKRGYRARVLDNFCLLVTRNSNIGTQSPFACFTLG